MSHRTVVVVEDNPDARELMVELLVDRGYPVLAAEHGQAALDHLRRANRPCLVLLDLHMPVMDGWKFQAELLRDPALRATPVVVLSAFGSHQALPPGVNGYIPKPVDVELLFAVVQRYCDRAELPPLMGT